MGVPYDIELQLRPRTGGTRWVRCIGRAYTREDLTDRAYGEGYHLAERTLDSHVRRIRAKLREHGLDPIETVHGLGYRLRA